MADFFQRLLFVYYFIIGYLCDKFNCNGGCAIRWFFDIEQMRFLQGPKSEMCEVQSKELDALIAALVKTKRDPEAWEGLKAFLQSAEEYSC